MRGTVSPCKVELSEDTRLLVRVRPCGPPSTIFDRRSRSRMARADTIGSQGRVHRVGRIEPAAGHPTSGHRCTRHPIAGARVFCFPWPCALPCVCVCVSCPCLRTLALSAMCRVQMIGLKEAVATTTRDIAIDRNMPNVLTQVLALTTTFLTFACGCIAPARPALAYACFARACACDVPYIWSTFSITVSSPAPR